MRSILGAQTLGTGCTRSTAGEHSILGVQLLGAGGTRPPCTFAYNPFLNDFQCSCVDSGYGVDNIDLEEAFVHFCAAGNLDHAEAACCAGKYEYTYIHIYTHLPIYVYINSYTLHICICIHTYIHIFYIPIYIDVSIHMH